MTALFSIVLGATVVVVLLLRLAVPQLPLRGLAVRLTGVDAILLVVGVIGLAFHCTAMFARQLFDPFPVIQPTVQVVNSSGPIGVILFAVPATLVIVALRRQRRAAVLLVALALLAVGITMYLLGSLPVHLITIFGATVLLAGVVVALTIAPWRKPALGGELGAEGGTRTHTPFGTGT